MLARPQRPRAALLGAAVMTAIGCVGSSVHAKTIVLTDGGKTDDTIVVAKNAVAPEKHAASELQAFLHEISGVKLPVVTDDQAVKGKRICVAPSKGLAQIAPSLDAKSLGLEGYHIKAAAATGGS